MPLQAHTSAIGSGGGVRVGIQRRRQPLQGRQIPAKKKGCLSARSNQRHTMAPFGVFLSGSEKAVAGTTQRCSLEVSSCAWPAFSNGLLLDR